MTAAERAAEDYAPIGGDLLGAARRGFLAGAAWQSEQARPVLTREQIIDAIESVRQYVPGSHGPDYATASDEADALLAQGDVPAQTTEPEPVERYRDELDENGHPEPTDAEAAWDDGHGFPGDGASTFPADREAAIRADQRERDAQIADRLTEIFRKGGSHISHLAAKDVAAAIREGNNHA